MPQRFIPLVTREIYHVFNRGSRKQQIFLDTNDYNRALHTLEFYSYSNNTMKYSLFNSISIDLQMNYLQKLRKENKRHIEILAFCLMPNHFHLLIRQLEDGGVSKFMRLLQNSYTRYFNTKYNEVGSLLQGQFKAVHIKDDSQLLHVSRYIHLNPYSSFIVNSLVQLEHYHFSSYENYSTDKNSFVCQTDIILSYFSSKEEYRKFVCNRADYQRTLEGIKHLILE